VAPDRFARETAHGDEEEIPGAIDGEDRRATQVVGIPSQSSDVDGSASSSRGPYLRDSPASREGGNREIGGDRGELDRLRRLMGNMSRVAWMKMGVFHHVSQVVVQAPLALQPPMNRLSPPLVHPGPGSVGTVHGRPRSWLYWRQLWRAWPRGGSEARVYSTLDGSPAGTDAECCVDQAEKAGATHEDGHEEQGAACPGHAEGSVIGGRDGSSQGSARSGVRCQGQDFVGLRGGSGAFSESKLPCCHCDAIGAPAWSSRVGWRGGLERTPFEGRMVRSRVGGNRAANSRGAPSADREGGAG
jgi:hypothetical protein